MAGRSNPWSLFRDNLVPRAFSLKKWEGRVKALASAGRFFFLIGRLKFNNFCNFSSCQDFQLIFYYGI